MPNLPWEAIAVVGLAIASGFGFWMFRIDRAITAIRHLQDEFDDFKADNEKDHTHIWSRLGDDNVRLNANTERITRLEPRTGHR